MMHARTAAAGLLGILLFCIGTSALYAQPNGPSAPSDTAEQAGPWVPPLRVLGRDAVNIARGPFTLSRAEGGWTLGAVGVLVGTAAVLDEPAFQSLSDRSAEGASDAWRDATRLPARPGEWYDRINATHFALGTVGGLAAGGLLLRHRGLTRTSVRTVEALLYTELINGFLKSILNRDRPFVGEEPEPFAYDPGAFSSKHEKLAMPSGHAARVFAIASVLSHQADRWYVSVPLYAGATSVGIERVRSGDHWLTDVLVGGAIGVLVGRSVTVGSELDMGTDESPSAASIQIAPVLSTRRAGVAVHF